MTLEELQILGKKDLAPPDQTRLYEELANVPQLLMKWGGQIYSDEWKLLYKLKKERLVLKLKLEEAFTGVTTQKEIIEDGIEINVPHGVKLTRGNASSSVLCNEYINTNPKMVALDDKIEMQNLKLKLIEKVVDSLRYRENNVGRLMDWHKWSEGFN